MSTSRIDDGEFVVLVGPSGCGKSTLLRMIAGLEEITSGEIRIGDKVVNNVPPKARDIAMVFQNYALYPHMTVFDNMAFSMKLAGRSQDEMRGRVDEAAKILGLTEYLDRYPRQLSGGQRQRVAMGRAIVRDPQVFLFDEPLSNLDAKLRVQMRTEIKELHQRLKTTSVYVTHDQIEAMTMADKIVVMNGGNVEQIGSPLELYDNPANLFVAGFIGSPAMNFLTGKLARNGARAWSRWPTAASCRCPAWPLGDGRAVTLGVRPEHLVIGEDGVAAEVVVVEPTGADTQVYCRLVGRGRHGRVARAPHLPARRHHPPAAAAGQDLSVRPGERRSGSPEPRATSEDQHDPHLAPRFPEDHCGVSPRAQLRACRCCRARPRPSSCRSSPSRAPSCACCAGSASCRATKTPGLANTRKFTEVTGVPVTRGERELGGPAAEGGGGRERGQRPGHHHRHQRRFAPVPGPSCWTCATWPSTWARSTAAGTTCSASTAMADGRWIALPLGAGGSAWYYRESHVKAAGFYGIPQDLDGFLKLCQALKAKGTPPGFALGHATGDANVLVPLADLVARRQAGGREQPGRDQLASRPRRRSSTPRSCIACFPPGTLSWLDPNNNKAFLSGEISLTDNGVSIYYAAMNSADPKVKAMAADINHANMPVGPVGRPTEMGAGVHGDGVQVLQVSASGQGVPALHVGEGAVRARGMEASLGFVAQPLTAYEQNPVWTSDPKRLRLSRCGQAHAAERLARFKLGPASAAAMADFIVVDMVAEAATGAASVEDAMKQAERRAKRYYG